MRQKFLFILALLLTAVTGAWADEWATVYMQTQTKQSDWTALSAGSTTGRTLGSAGNTTFYYVTSNLSFTNATAGGSGLTILGTVYLYVPEGMTVTCIGANANGTTGAGAGIELSLGNSLYLLGSGTLNATGGNAANGETGGTGGNATGGNGSWTQTGAGGTGGNGGGGAGAGIGTRGGAGGSGGAGGGGNYYNDGKEDDAFGGTNGTSGSAGATAGAMGALYVSNAITVSATGGHAGSSGGSGGQRGRGYAYDGYSYNVTVAGGGGGGGGGFGGAASNIGTGGPGGGGGGGGAGGAQDWRPNSKGGVYDVTAPGGHGGQNANGGYAGDGTEAGTNGTAQSQGWVTVENGSFDSDDWNSASGDAPAGTAGNGGGKGGNTTAGSAVTVNMEWTSLQEDDWGMVCLLTQTSRANWTLLTDGSQTGMTLGEAGKTTYYYTMIDRFFSNSNAGGSGLTILGTVYLYIPSGKTITCTGAHASGTTGGGAGIELTAGNTLYLLGSGTVNATGGNAANGGNGAGGGHATYGDEWVRSGDGGRGGDGGGGAGAGIGTRGGTGGAGGAGGAGKQENDKETTGNVGSDGAKGGTAAEMGTLYIYDASQAFTPQKNIRGGNYGANGGTGGTGGLHVLCCKTFYLNSWTIGGGGGGGGGGFGGVASNIGTGGPGGGGGGGGSSGTIAYNDDIDGAFYQVGALGGSPGNNADGSTTAGSGANTLLDTERVWSGNSSNLYQYTPINTYDGEKRFKNQGWENGDNRAAGGTGGASGSASTSSTANAVTVGWPTQGKGTEGDPVIISSAADWNNFVTSVNNGANCSGTYLKLTADISVTTMVGTSDANSFQGTFLGNGQTLTFTKGTSAEPFAEEYCAPFRHVKNAVIKNLHVDGTIYTNQKKAAGIVGISHQNLSITGCRSSIAINSSTVTGDDNHDGTHGGFVGTLSGENNTVTIDGCVFDGSFATTNGTINCGGFIGWVTYNKPTITNSLMAPASVGAGMVANTFSRWHTGYEPTITNCYYVATDNLPTNQGMEAVANALLDIGSLVQDYGMVKAYEHGIFYNGTYYVDPDMVSDFRLLSTATAQDVGKVVCAAGHLHDAKRAVPDGCTAVGVLGKVTSTGHGLILALQDATSQTWNTINGWESVTGYAGTTLKLLPNDNARGNLASYTSLGVVAVSDWCVAQKGDYDAIFTNLGSTKGDNNGKICDANVNAYITNAGGAATNKTGYWSATEYSSENGWFFGESYWYYSRKTSSHNVRPVLGFAASAIAITLADNADNSTTISNANGYVADVTLTGRTLYKDGAWNTICLPFDVTIAGSPLAGATARPLTSASISGSTLTLTFGDAVTTLKAGTPYIIKWASGDNIVSPVFSGVTINATDRSYDNGESDDTQVRFLGTYKYTAFGDIDKSILLVGGNTLYYPESGASIGAQRAYFKIGEDGAPARQLTDFNIDFGEGETTSLSEELRVKSEEFATAEGWYTLDGRKLDKKPTKKELYIHNGRKVIIN